MSKHPDLSWTEHFNQKQTLLWTLSTCRSVLFMCCATASPRVIYCGPLLKNILKFLYQYLLFALLCRFPSVFCSIGPQERFSLQIFVQVCRSLFLVTVDLLNSSYCWTASWINVAVNFTLCLIDFGHSNQISDNSQDCKTQLWQVLVSPELQWGIEMKPSKS